MNAANLESLIKSVRRAAGSGILVSNILYIRATLQLLTLRGITVIVMTDAAIHGLQTRSRENAEKNARKSPVKTQVALLLCDWTDFYTIVCCT